MKITNETDVQVVVCIHLYLASVFISTPEGHWRDEVFPRKWLDYSAQGHGIMHSSCRAHTAMTLAFWVRGRLELAAGTDTHELWAVGGHQADRLQSSFSLRPAWLAVHLHSTPSVCCSFGSLAVFRLNTETCTRLCASLLPLTCIPRPVDLWVLCFWMSVCELFNRSLPPILPEEVFQIINQHSF